MSTAGVAGVPAQRCSGPCELSGRRGLAGWPPHTAEKPLRKDMCLPTTGVAIMGRWQGGGPGLIFSGVATKLYMHFSKTAVHRSNLSEILCENI